MLRLREQLTGANHLVSVASNDISVFLKNYLMLSIAVRTIYCCESIMHNKTCGLVAFDMLVLTERRDFM